MSVDDDDDDDDDDDACTHVLLSLHNHIHIRRLK
jgi:hypothetical protein